MRRVLHLCGSPEKGVCVTDFQRKCKCKGNSVEKGRSLQQVVQAPRDNHM